MKSTYERKGKKDMGLADQAKKRSRSRHGKELPQMPVKREEQQQRVTEKEIVHLFGCSPQTSSKKS